jgi:hypothetical protein
MVGKKTLLIAAAVMFVVAPAMVAPAGDASFYSPGHKMHRYGSAGHPGASYWAPGHQKRLYGSVRTGTSRYAPHHQSY